LALKRSLPSTANIKNPVDVIGDARADRYVAAISAAFKDKNVDGVFVILTPQSMTDIETIAKEITVVAAQFNKPIYTSFMGEADVSSGIQILQNHNIPHYILPESMCKPFMTVYNFNQQSQKAKETQTAIQTRESAEAKILINNALKSNKKYLYEFEATKVLSEYDLPVIENKLAKSADEAIGMAKEIGFPVVMKIMSNEIVHKFDVGGVILNINSAAEAEAAFHKITSSVKTKMPNASIKGIQVSKQIQEGVEVILGIKKDPSFEAVIMFGIGGIFVEIFKDVSFRVAPVSKSIALEMIHEIKASTLLYGARGQKPADIESLSETIVKLSHVALDCSQIKELDINPLIVLEKGDGCYIADARIILE
jgi:acetyltransferase